MQFNFDSVLIRSETRVLSEVTKRLNNGRYRFNFKGFEWNKTQRSKLIESCLMRIPLTAFYLAEEVAGYATIVDGNQRLTTFALYLDNYFPLHGLDKGINGQEFRDLSAKLQNRLEKTELTLHFIDSKVPKDMRFDIFKRVNSPWINYCRHT